MILRLTGCRGLGGLAGVTTDPAEASVQDKPAKRAYQPGPGAVTGTSTEVTGQSKLHLATVTWAPEPDGWARHVLRDGAGGAGITMAGRRGTGEGQGRRRGRTGGKPGPEVRKQLYATHHGGAGGGPEPTQPPAAVPVMTGAARR